MIPLSEPALQGKELEYVTDCLRSGWISSNGEYIGRFEEALADYVGVKHAVACNCGTSALHVSSHPLPGSSRTTRSSSRRVTFIAPVNAVRYVGAWPVFVDCDEYCCIDVDGVRRFLAEECEQRRRGADQPDVPDGEWRRSSPCTCSARSADMDSILETGRDATAICRSSRTPARRSARCTRAGCAAAWLRSACLSFNGNKIVTSGGGGAILTNDDALAKQARYLTTQAKEDGIEYIHHRVGYNYRMNNVLAAFGLAQLETIDERLAVKRKNFALYEQALGPGRLLRAAGVERRQPLVLRLCVQRRGGEGARDRRLPRSRHPGASPVVPESPSAALRRLQAYQIDRATGFYERLVNLPCSVTLTPEHIAEVSALLDRVDPARPMHP